MLFEPQSLNLLLTERGRTWLEQFDEADRPMIRQLTDALSLVSVQEFERILNRLIEKFARKDSGPVALYAAREVPKGTGLTFRISGSGLSSVSEGSDVGSEGRVANIVRQICRTQPTQLLRQPSIETLLRKRVPHIVVVDDIIGSGKRTRDYLNELWTDPTIKSWWSYKKVRFTVVAYAGTAEGIRYVRQHPCKPEVEVHRYCPTLDALPWPREQRRKALRLLSNYLNKYDLKGPIRGLGFRDSAALLVFEHGCPNNVPNIYWADSRSQAKAWLPLFPGRATTADSASVFPHELASRTPVSVLLNAGQHAIANALPLVLDRPLSQQTIIVLGLLGRGINRMEAIAHATGLGVRECHALVETCIESGLVSPRRRLSDAGIAELAGIATAATPRSYHSLKLGEDCYYPVSLRGRIDG